MKTQTVTLKDEFGCESEIHTFFKFRKDKLRRRALYPPRVQPITSLTGKRVQHEWFEEGRRQPLPGEQPLPGASQEALQQHIFEFGRQRTMVFYCKARLDGLVRRVELFFDAKPGEQSDESSLQVKKIMEHYQDRDDRLIYRSATFHEQPSARHLEEARNRGM